MEDRTTELLASITKRKNDSLAKMNAARVKPEPEPQVTIDEGPAGELEGMGQLASNLRGQRPESPEAAADRWEKVGGKWVKRGQ